MGMLDGIDRIFINDDEEMFDLSYHEERETPTDKEFISIELVKKLFDEYEGSPLHLPKLLGTPCRDK